MTVIDDKFKWLARDKDGELWAFENEPHKDSNSWEEDDSDYFNTKEVEESDSTYSFVKWEDEEPTKIEDVQQESEQNKTETVNKPSHYIGVNGMEVEEVLREFLPKIKDGYVAHRVGSAVEYLLRHPEKNKEEDILKAGQNIKQITDYNERKLIGLKDLQQESYSNGVVKEATDSFKNQMEDIKDVDEMKEFLKEMAKIDNKKTWTNYFVPGSDISTFYGGTNEND